MIFCCSSPISQHKKNRKTCAPNLQIKVLNTFEIWVWAQQNDISNNKRMIFSSFLAKNFVSEKLSMARFNQISVTPTNHRQFSCLTGEFVGTLSIIENFIDKKFCDWIVSNPQYQPTTNLNSDIAYLQLTFCNMNFD